MNLSKLRNIGIAAHIDAGKNEREIAAGIEYIFNQDGGAAAFPSIVGSGPNSVVLHYDDNNRVMQSGEVVVVDCGAQINGYCGDLTRTYPVNGTFSKRQKEVYNLVLKVQEYIASKAVPGMWINNPDKTEQSLQHLAKAFLKDYAQYFTHGIGHRIGLDVHDISNHQEPLAVGDVITIEPGLYISKENLGIRIEDVYWITDGPAVCLSEDLPRSAEMIEDMMSAEFEEDEYVECDEEDCKQDDCCN